MSKESLEEDDDWRQCAEWLNRCQVLPDDHPVLGPGGNAIHLVQALMDGVILCHLLGALSSNEIDVRSMKDFSSAPQNSQFFCFQNLRLFTMLCEKEFNVPKKFLFHPSDVYNAKNFGKAITLLSELSHSPRSQLTGIEGFPSKDAKLNTIHQYYNNLEEMAAALDKLPDSGKTTYAQMEEESKEKLYDTVVYQGTKPRFNLNTEPTTARMYCIREIVDTEKNYVDVLRILIENYKHPLTGVLSHHEIEEIFKYIEYLHSIHRNLLSDLCLATSSTINFLNLSDVFLKAREQLLIYGEYCGHVQHAQLLVVEIMRNDVEKRARIEVCQSNSEKYNKFTLTELLTIPMQRVLKYHLLLEHLCKLTPADHPERVSLGLAHDAMREVSFSINEVKRDLDTISSIDQIQASLLEIVLPRDKKLSSYGRLHIDGEVKVLSQTESKAKMRYLFLFDKVLICCKPKGESYIFMIAYHITNTSFQKVTLPSKKGEKYSYGFTLPISGDKETPKLTFFTKSEESRTTWMKAARTALSNICPPGAKDRGYNFEMFTFKQPTYCCICNKLLLGIFFQGYRCRETYRTAHRACLANHNLPFRIPPNPHINGNGPPQLPPQSNAVRTRRLPPPIDSMPCTPCSMQSRTCNSTTTLNSGTSISELFDFSQFCNPLSSVNHWLENEQRNMATASLQRNRHTSSLTPGTDLSAHQSTITNFATAIESYNGDPFPPSGSTPLQFTIGDQIELIKWTLDGPWWRGYCNGSDGWFPSAYVELVNPSSKQITTNSNNSSLQTIIRRYQTQRHSLPIETSNMQDGSKESWINFEMMNRNSNFLQLSPVVTNTTPVQVSTPSTATTMALTSPPTGRQSLLPVSTDSQDSLTGYDWYVGKMDRMEAVTLLGNCEDGTFLVRVSKSAERMGEYSLSIVYGHPRHIRIQRIVSADNSFVAFGLSELEQFSSIPALIDHYSKVSLNRCFEEVDITLMYPYQKNPSSPLFYVIAKYSFNDESNSRYLPLKQGDRVAVVSLAAEDRGWLKGWLNGKVGFFPLSFVTREA